MALTKRLSANNIRTSLAGAISAVATNMTVQSGVGATLPSPNNANGEFFDFTIQDQATGLRVEIVAVTAVVGDLLTIVRGQQSTTGQAWNAGDTCFLGVTKGAYDSWVQPVQEQTNAFNHATAGGTSDAITATYTPAYAAWVDGMTFFVKITAANTTTTPTVSPNGLAAKTIVKGAGSALRKDDLVVGMIAEFKYSATLDKVVCQNPDTLTSGIVASGINIVTTTSALTAAMAGGLVRFNSASAIVPTLPAANTYAAGKLLRLVNNNAGVATVTRAGSDTITVNSATVTTIAMGLGDTLELISDGVSTWYAVGGSSQLGSAAAFKYSRGAVGAAGYSYLPNGMILQWLSGQTTSGVGAFTFPLTFPNVCCSCLPTYSGNAFAAGACVTQINGFTATGGGVIFSNGAGSATTALAGAVPYYIIAIGY